MNHIIVLLVRQVLKGPHRLFFSSQKYVSSSRLTCPCYTSFLGDTRVISVGVFNISFSILVQGFDIVSLSS